MFLILTLVPCFEQVANVSWVSLFPVGIIVKTFRRSKPSKSCEQDLNLHKYSVQALFVRVLNTTPQRQSLHFIESQSDSTANSLFHGLIAPYISCLIFLPISNIPTVIIKTYILI